jgi:site-specific DNA-methyltransferase (adenine-specific)
VLKPGGSAVIFAGRRLSHRCICALEDAGFSYKDMLAWMKQKCPHRAQRLSRIYQRRGDEQSAKTWEGWRLGNLRPIFEPILWFTKPYKIGETIADNVLKYGIGAYHEAAFLRYEAEPENVLYGRLAPKEGGLHPTQKPLRLMKALIELTTCPGQVVLDPFAGSGTALVAAAQLGRRYVGYEISPVYVQTSRQRLQLCTPSDCAAALAGEAQ